MQYQSWDTQIFEKTDYTAQTIKGAEFQSCIFRNCDLSGSIFYNSKFLDCTFESCNLSLAKFSGSTLSNIAFKECKILGVIFSECQDFLFAVNFDACILDYSSFMGKKMLKTCFRKSVLKDVNFSQSNLAGAVFDHCDLSGAIFNSSELTSANFATAYNYAIEPELNNIKKAIFSLDGLPGLLTKYGIEVI